LEDVVDHLDALKASGDWGPRIEHLPYFDGPVLEG
jgi:hypothetical protein